MSDGQSGMHVGVQGIGTSKVELEFLVRHGVTHMDASVEDNEVETLVKHKAEAAYGVSMESIDRHKSDLDTPSGRPSTEPLGQPAANRQTAVLHACGQVS